MGSGKQSPQSLNKESAAAGCQGVSTVTQQTFLAGGSGFAPSPALSNAATNAALAASKVSLLEDMAGDARESAAGRGRSGLWLRSGRSSLRPANFLPFP